VASAVADKPQFTVEDDDQKKPQFSVEDDASATPPATAAPEQKEPTFLEKASQGKASLWDTVKHAANPLNIPGDVSETLGKVGDWSQKKAEQKHTEELGNIAKGGQAPEMSAYTPAAGYDLLGRIAHMGSGATSPTNVAIGAGAIAAPEIVGPALLAHGGYNAIKAGADIADKGANPENVENLLTSGAEVVGGGASLGEIPARGGISKTLTGRLADKAVRGTPLTEEGRIAAATQQAQVVKPPTQNETEYAARVKEAIPELQQVAQANVGKIKTPRDAVNALNERISQIEAPISDLVKGNDTIVHPDQYTQGIEDKVSQRLNQNPGTFKPKEIEAAKNAVREFVGDQPKSLEELENNRRRLNDDANDYYKAKKSGQRSMDVSDATAVAQRTAADAIRDMLYGDEQRPGLLEGAGVEATDENGNPLGLRDMRRKVGNLLEIRNHFEDAITKAENAGDWKLSKVMRSGPSLAAGGAGALFGMLSGGPVGLGAGLAAGEVGKAIHDYKTSKNPNLNVQKMFRNLADTSPSTGIGVNAAPRAPSYEWPVGPQIGHAEPIGPKLPPEPFELGPIGTPAAREGMWQQQVGTPPEIGWGGPTSPYREPIGPKFQEESHLGPIQGTQTPLHLPTNPQEAPLFNLPNINAPRNVPEIQRLAGTQTAPPVGMAPEGSLPPIGGAGREGTLSRIGGGTPKPSGVSLGAGEDLGEGLGTQHVITKDGQRIGSITVEPKDGGKTLHVHWLGGDFGPGLRPQLMDEVERLYPEAEKFTYDRRRLAKGAEAATTEQREMKIKKMTPPKPAGQT
jgi:hypothetical protein